MRDLDSHKYFLSFFYLHHLCLHKYQGEERETKFIAKIETMQLIANCQKWEAM